MAQVAVDGDELVEVDDPEVVARRLQTVSAP